MKKDNTTIKDVAKKLNISIATVSRALNDSWEVKKETRDLVVKTAEEMHYHPNAHARGLVTKKSRTIGFIVPDLVSTNYFTIISQRIQKELLFKGYQLIIAQSVESPTEERRLLKMMLDFNVDGIIISTATDSNYNKDIFEELIQKKIPLVFISRVCYNVKAPRIVVNDAEIAKKVTEHLLDEGCRKIVYLSGPTSMALCRIRYQGYCEALKRRDIEIDPNLVIDTGLFQDDGHETILHMLDEGIIPDGIFSSINAPALGVVKALKKRGYRIPQDIAVAGFTDSALSTIIEPNLTAVSPPLEEMGLVAIQQLFRQIEGFEAKDITITLPSKLIIRESTQRRIITSK